MTAIGISPGRAALAAYNPKHLTSSEWGQWGPRVRDLVGDAHPDVAQAAINAAGALTRLIALIKPDPEAPWTAILEERNVAPLLRTLESEGTAQSTVRRTQHHLRRLQRVAIGLPAASAGATTRRRPRDVTRLLLVLQRTAGDPSLGGVCHTARVILDELAELKPEPWPGPASASDMAALNRHLHSISGVETTRVWESAKTESIRNAFAEPVPCRELLAWFRPGHRRLDSLVEARDPVHNSLALGQGMLLRGQLHSLAHGQSISLPDSSFPCGVLPFSGSRWVTHHAPMSPWPREDNASSPPKMSAAQMRRAMKTERERLSNGPGPLPEKLERILQEWRPRTMTPDEWAVCRGLTLDIMRCGHIRGEESFRKHLRIVAPFAYALISAGYEASAVEVLTAAAIDHYIHFFLDAPDSTRATVRADLRNLATKAALSDGAPVASQRISHWKATPPYTAREVYQIREAIPYAPTPEAVWRLQVAVGLGLGAGLDLRDMTGMTRGDLDDRGEEGIVVNVGGERSRTVWLRADCEAMLREGVAGMGRQRWLLGTPEPSKGILNQLYEKHLRPLEHGQHVSQRRLRHTWLVTLMTEPIPLWTILNAAGLATARTLLDLCAYLVPVTDTQAVRGQ